MIKSTDEHIQKDICLMGGTHNSEYLLRYAFPLAEILRNEYFKDMRLLPKHMSSRRPLYDERRLKFNK